MNRCWVVPHSERKAAPVEQKTKPRRLALTHSKPLPMTNNIKVTLTYTAIHFVAIYIAL